MTHFIVSPHVGYETFVEHFSIIMIQRLKTVIILDGGGTESKSIRSLSLGES